MTIPHQDSVFRFHSIDDVARQLHVSSKSIRRWIAAGRLVSHRLGRQIRISQRDLEGFLSASRK
jgi:excisionase family DNA binding protein